MIVGNAYAPFFRVNSIFWDPSIYGRYLTVGILTALAGILLGGVRGWKLGGLYAVVAAMWVGLFFSFSQSSYVALAVGVVVAAFVVWGRIALVAVVGLVLVFLLVSLATPQVRHRVEKKSRSGLNSVTSDRATLVGQGLRIAVAPSPRRCRGGRVQAGLRRPARPSRQAAEEGRLPHDTGHGGRRGGAPGPRCSSAGSASRRWLRRCAGSVAASPRACRSPWALR